MQKREVPSEGLRDKHRWCVDVDLIEAAVLGGFITEMWSNATWMHGDNLAGVGNR